MARDPQRPMAWRSDSREFTIMALKNGGATVQVTIGGTYMGTEIAPEELVEILAFFADLSHADPITYNYHRAQALEYERAYVLRNPPTPEGEEQ
jgi:hypothetical protein